MRFIWRFGVTGFALLLTCAVFKPSAAQGSSAQDSCRFFNSAAGSHITRTSHVISQRGASAGEVSDYCRLPYTEISPRLSALGNDGKLYSLRDAFRAAEYLTAVSSSAAPPRRFAARAFAPPPPPPDPWTSTLQPQFALLQKMVGGNSNPCGDHTNQCLGDFAGAISAAQTMPAPVQLAVPDFIVGSKARGRDGKHPLFGATVSTVIATPSPNGAPPTYTAVTTLTLSAENQLFDAFTISQTFGVGAPVTYQLRTDMGSALGNHASYSLGPVSASSLALQQSQSLGGTFEYCPHISIPLVRGVAFNVDASAACEGTATLQYDTNLQPNIGYVRIAPSIDLKLRGTVSASAFLITGTAQADVDIATFDGGTGVMYGSFDEPGYGQMFALRPFAYYSGQALSVDVTVAVKAFFGAQLGRRTFHVYDGAILQPLSLDKTSWSVVRLANAHEK